MKKKVLGIGVIIILTVMLFILTGCGNSNNSTTDSLTNNKEEEKLLSKKITANNYGDKVNYSANGINEWKIFYNDGENVFIITSSLLPNRKVADSVGLQSRQKGYLKNFNVIWDWDNPEYKKYKGTSSIDKALAKKYQLEWIERHAEDTENSNMRIIASLFDANNWSSLIDKNYAESVIGSPTLEMFVKSWNEKYPNEKLYYSDGEYGYNIGKVENPDEEGVYDLENLKEDKLYNIVPEEFGDDGMGFTLASPNASARKRSL